MPITRQGWELYIKRNVEQKRSSDGKRRTVGEYQVYHDGVAQTGPGMKGQMAESRGPGDNDVAGNHRRVEAGRYPIATQAGTKYVTIGYTSSQSSAALPRPGIELLQTGNRSEILIHPGIGFLASIGCLNPCTNLPDATEPIDFVPSRARVIRIIDDLKQYLGARFPTANGKTIPDARVVIDGEPSL